MVLLTLLWCGCATAPAKLKNGKTKTTSSATSLHGSKNAEKEMDAYMARVIAELRRGFPDFPQWKILNLIVTLHVHIDERGQATHITIINPSKRAEFDAEVLAHMEKISSFGPPPHSLRDELLNKGFDILFCLYECP